MTKIFIQNNHHYTLECSLYITHDVKQIHRRKFFLYVQIVIYFQKGFTFEIVQEFFLFFYLKTISSLNIYFQHTDF